MCAWKIQPEVDKKYLSPFHLFIFEQSEIKRNEMHYNSCPNIRLAMQRTQPFGKNLTIFSLLDSHFSYHYFRFGCFYPNIVNLSYETKSKQTKGAWQRYYNFYFPQKFTLEISSISHLALSLSLRLNYPRNSSWIVSFWPLISCFATFRHIIHCRQTTDTFRWTFQLGNAVTTHFPAFSSTDLYHFDFNWKSFFFFPRKIRHKFFYRKIRIVQRKMNTEYSDLYNIVKHAEQQICTINCLRGKALFAIEYTQYREWSEATFYAIDL